MRLINAERFEESIDMMCDAGGVLQPVTEAVRQFCKEKVRAEPTYKVEPKETRLDLINEIAIRMGKSQGCLINCLECKDIICSVGSVIKEIYKIIKDGEENAVDR